MYIHKEMDPESERHAWDGGLNPTQTGGSGSCLMAVGRFCRTLCGKPVVWCQPRGCAQRVALHHCLLQTHSL